MRGRVPVLATIMVAAAVALMIWLGLWQLDRAKWKAGVLAQAAAAEKLPPIAFPTRLAPGEKLPLFRHATGVCLKPLGQRAIAGQNAGGDSGYAMIVECSAGAPGARMAVQVGWTKNPNAKVNWPGGPVSGVIVPDSRSRIRLVAASAPPGLEPSRVPDTSSISSITPSTHHGYAATWFALASAAALIFALALWRRMRREEPAK